MHGPIVRFRPRALAAVALAAWALFAPPLFAQSAPAGAGPEPPGGRAHPREVASAAESLPAPRWTARIDALDAAIEEDSGRRAEADALYGEVNASVARAREAMRAALRGEGRDTEAAHDRLVAAYAARVRLQPLLTPEGRARATASDRDGIAEIWTELDYVALHIRYHVREIPAGLREMVTRTPGAAHRPWAHR